MQRWWFLDNKTNTSNQSSSYAVPTKSVEKYDQERNWNFRVHVTQKLQPFEQIAITGECSSLGKWISQHCVYLRCDEGMSF